MSGPESAVERYLDEMFDRLAGTGPAGRRMLAETESHLLDAVADGRARGLDTEAAERAAIDRFGTVAGVVRHVPAAGRDVRDVVLRLLATTWIAAGAALLWWGGSGVLTWLLGWPWTRLLIDTDRFGAQPGMCSRPWIPLNPAIDCFTQYREYLNPVPHGGDRDTYPWMALAGLLLLVAWLVLRRLTRTPAPVGLGLGVAAPFGLVALVLTVYGVTGLTQQTQDWSLSYLVAGLSAAAVSIVAARHTSRRSSTADG